MTGSTQKQMTPREAGEFAARVLDAWNAHDVERALAHYTEDLVYRDPNTRSAVVGAPAMRTYLARLFGLWRMHWTVREIFPLLEGPGHAVLWHATLQRASGGPAVATDGMDLVLLRDGRIARNEVYFDRAVLAPLLSA